MENSLRSITGYFGGTISQIGSRERTEREKGGSERGVRDGGGRGWRETVEKGL